MDESHLCHGSVDRRHLRNEAISSEKIADRSILSQHIQPEQITGEHLAKGEITSDHLAPGSISEESIDKNIISSHHIGEKQVNGNHLAEESVDSKHLVGESVTSHHIQEQSIQSHHIADGSIELDKLSPNLHSVITGITVHSGITPFQISENLTETTITISLSEADSDSSFVPVAMLDHPDCFVGLDSFTGGTFKFRIERRRSSSNPIAGFLFWMATPVTMTQDPIPDPSSASASIPEEKPALEEEPNMDESLRPEIEEDVASSLSNGEADPVSVDLSCGTECTMDVSEGTDLVSEKIT